MKKDEALPAVSQQELLHLISWLSAADILPDEIKTGLSRVLAVYSNLAQGATRAKRTLLTLRQAMGIVPKSERGKGQKQVPPATDVTEPLSMEGWDPEKRRNFEALTKKRLELARQSAEYNRKLRAFGPLPKADPEQMSFELARPQEMLFSYPAAIRERVDEKPRVDRMKEFGKKSGLHVAHDRPKRMEMKVVVTEIQYEVETVTDPETGKSVRASMADAGPAGCLYTWVGIANLIKMHVGFAIPIHRMSLIIGQPEFTPANIYRALRRSALGLLPIYLHLAEELSEAGILSGDDTVTKVLDHSPATDPDSLSRKIDEELGFSHPYARKVGLKQALNVSLLVGKPKADPRSTIRFFRTHAGSVGNLLNTILTFRSPKAGSVIFQGDSSSSNLPTPEMRERFKLAVAGCGAHARRPFWKLRDQDPSLCYFMLRGFLILSRIEKIIDSRGRNEETVKKLRGRYGRMTWQALRNRCTLAIGGKRMGRATYPRDIHPDIWPPGHELHRASTYVIKHFESLTLYLDHPALEYTNNGSERGVRIEKCMLSSSKFRRNRDGRAVLDVLRTINSTCTAAMIDPADYMRYVFKHEDEIHDHPERFTPYAVARILEVKSQDSAAEITLSLN
jgi:hypothetical protein